MARTDIVIDITVSIIRKVATTEDQVQIGCEWANQLMEVLYRWVITQLLAKFMTWMYTISQFYSSYSTVVLLTSSGHLISTPWGNRSRQIDWKRLKVELVDRFTLISFHEYFAIFNQVCGRYSCSRSRSKFIREKFCTVEKYKVVIFLSFMR